MATIIDTLPTKRVWVVTCKTPGCDGHHRRNFDTEEEATAYGLGPESAGLMDVRETVVVDWPEVDRRRDAYLRMERTSCAMPPESDLLLLSRAKATAPEDYRTIDPDAGAWPRTRERLRLIRNDKRNDYYTTLR